jgi:malonyl-CoA O-methyltransferase
MSVSSRLSGVFVAGTDTGVGKSFVSACLVRAWSAAYFKPLQTGLAAEAGDSATIAALTGARCHAPLYEFAAPLAPFDAACAEGRRIDETRLTLPDEAGTLVVEGAGGLMVPITDTLLMIDLIARYGLPVVLVARSTLGTINHTLLSLEALRARGLPVAGVVLNGPPAPHNRAAIERFGHAAIIAETPPCGTVDARAITDAARLIPPLDAVMAQAAQ